MTEENSQENSAPPAAPGTAVQRRLVLAWLALSWERLWSRLWVVGVLFGLLNGVWSGIWTTVFLLFTILTNVTGLMFPFNGFLPSHAVAILSLVLLAVALVLLVPRSAPTYPAGSPEAAFQKAEEKPNYLGNLTSLKKLVDLDGFASPHSDIVALMVLAILFGAGSFLASGLLAPYRPNSAKEAPYECGIVPSRDNPERFPVSFYVIAMLFIMFDIELIFIYPFAVDRQFLGTYAFWEMVAFSVVFFAAFIYVIARGALEWGPVARQLRLEPSIGAAATGVRIVGLEGRPGQEVA